MIKILKVLKKVLIKNKKIIQTYLIILTEIDFYHRTYNNLNFHQKNHKNLKDPNR